MPGFINAVGETACLNGGFKATAGPAAFYVALATNTAGSITDTTAMSAIVEPTDTAYARKSIAFTSPTQENGKTVIKNSAQIDFTAWAANASVAINYAIITDNSQKNSGGNYYGNIYAVIPLEDGSGNPAPITPQATQPARISQNALVISLD